MKNYFKEGTSRLFNNSKFKKEYLPQLPQEYHLAAKLLYYYKFAMTGEEKAVGRKIEEFRSQILKEAKISSVNSYTSPRSNTFKKKENSNHAEAGEYTSATIENVMQVGSNVFKGTLLRRIVEGTGSKRVLELGTNTGFASSYFVSLPGVELVTIEGSEEVCKIAKRNIDRISKDYRLMNTLFDDAIDQLAAENEKFDCVYLDGQHEQVATIHYAKRLAPIMSDKSIFIFDDIYWSEDMNKAWHALIANGDYSEGVDLQLLGVLRKSNGENNTVLHDINKYLPRPSFHRENW